MRLTRLAFMLLGAAVALADWLRAMRGTLTHLLTLEAVAERTIICFTFSDGSGRTFHYPSVLGKREADAILDDLIDEMRGKTMDAPIEVVRYFEGGQITHEAVGMCPLEE